MATRPQARAPQASAEDDFYGEDEFDQGAEGQDDFGEERDDNDETGGAAEHPGQGDPELEETDGLGDEEPPPPRRGEGRLQRLANER